MYLLIAVAAYALLVAGVVAFGRWVLIRWRRKRAAQRWSNTEYAPPAFDAVPVHLYQPAKLTPCCRHCGGGELHSVHSLGSFLDTVEF